MKNLALIAALTLVAVPAFADHHGTHKTTTVQVKTIVSTTTTPVTTPTTVTPAK